MKVLLSIKPEFVEKIIAGDKRFEFRRRIFKKEVVSVIIYASSPRQEVIGEFTIDDIIESELSLLWKKTHKYSGIEKDFFWQYFKGSKIGYALKIGKLQLYDSPIMIDVFGVKPPQSYVYINTSPLYRKSSY